MPRENSFTDSEGRSLTPDLEDEFDPVPRSASPAQLQPEQSHMLYDNIFSNEYSQDSAPQPTQRTSSSMGPTSPRLKHAAAPHFQSPKDRFRTTVRKIISMRRTSTILSRYGLAGAEPGIDPRRHSANIQYAHIRERCMIQIADYSTVRSSFGKMDNERFVKLLNDDACSRREPWAKVRWINMCGISWDVISALALKYGMLCGEDIEHYIISSRLYRPSPPRPRRCPSQTRTHPLQNGLLQQSPLYPRLVSHTRFLSI